MATWSTSPSRVRALPREDRSFCSLRAIPRDLPDNWRSWPELTVRIHGLPYGVPASMIWGQFHEYGEIVYIEVYKGRKSLDFSARVKFSPPPSKAFWEPAFWEGEQFMLHHHDTLLYPNGVPVNICPDTRPPPDWVISSISEKRSLAGKATVQLHGVRLGSATGPKKLTVAQSWDHEPSQPEFRLEMNIVDKHLSAFFHTKIQAPTGPRLQSCKMKINVSQVRRVYRTLTPHGDETLIMALEFPPQYWLKKAHVPAGMSDGLVWGESDAWHRASCIVDTHGSLSEQPVSVSGSVEEPGHLDLGRLTTLQFLLKSGQEHSKACLIEALDNLNIRIQDASRFEIVAKGRPDMWRLLDSSSPSGGNTLSMFQMWSDQVHLSFEVRYSLEVCISRGTLHEDNISRELLEKLAATDPTKAQTWLEHMAERGEPTYDPMAWAAGLDAVEPPEKRRVPEFCYLVRKAVVTPTTMYLNVPSFETSNRVIRKYNHVADRFLKVQFVEEGEQGRLRAAAGESNDQIWQRVWRVLNRGIRIGDRVYEFLAFGNSQLRECGAYFFSPTQYVSCDDIRTWAGDFDHIRVIAKYAARLGQCFSTTRVLQGITSPTIRSIPDISRNGYCFTDGVGKISRFLADFIAAEMPGNEGERPTAFQFRMGGSKGVLVVSDDAKDKEVHIRPSQEKFRAQFNKLEIVRCARPATATLNRQIITVLSDLGVPDGAFICLLEQQLRKYDASTTDNAVAVELLRKFVDQNQTSLIIAELIRSGFRTSLLKEQFVLNIFSLWRSWSLKLLKEKARIHVEQSAFVIGCVDETGTLRGHSFASEGTRLKDVRRLPQIFLQTVNPKTGKLFVLKGICVVGRNPSLHPGDIRVVQAVDCPKLRYLKDVVVFPSKGDRPVPSMLSGGDLDGDDFFVIWDQTLMPQIWNWRPMSFSPIKPLELARDVNSHDLRQFFVQYMMNDVLPLIAISHLAWADEMKPRSDICLQLADMHSHAVDYPKTGEPVDWEKRKFWPRRWPHFMEKHKSRSYESTKVLGRLYDNVTKENISFEPVSNHAFDRRVLERYKLQEASLSKARRIKEEYDRSVRRILAQLSLKTEFELWTGFAMSKPTIGTEYKRQEVLGQEAETLKLHFRGLCEDACGGSSPENLDPFVAAMYKVTEEETIRFGQKAKEEEASNEQGGNDSDDSSEGGQEPRSMKTPLITFPWLFPEVMVRIALGDQWVNKKPWFSPSRGSVKTGDSLAVDLQPPQL